MMPDALGDHEVETPIEAEDSPIGAPGDVVLEVGLSTPLLALLVLEVNPWRWR
jgi:hypothetical protein